MRNMSVFGAVLALVIVAHAAHGEDPDGAFDGAIPLLSHWKQPPLPTQRVPQAEYRARHRGGTQQHRPFRFEPIFRAQSADTGGSDGGSGAGAATDPSQPLTQIQLQNSFIPNTYNAEGYSNVFAFQPVIPLHLGWDGIPYHIIRPTLPVISPTANPDGTADVEGGLGDLTLIDIYVYPMKELKTNVGVGPVIIAPTATHPQLGLREWQLGPSIFAITKAVPKWNLGFLVQIPFSMESDAYTVQMQPIAVRLLPNEWYVGVGDLLWNLDDRNGNYDIPLSVRIGKVQKIGNSLFNIFLQPQYTPRDSRVVDDLSGVSN